MRGPYENDWRNAFDGASTPPSEALWDNISASMDQRYGKRNWVTILLIAATISITFAFPLTVGNSSFELRPDDFEVANIMETPQHSTLPTQTVEAEDPTLAQLNKTERIREVKPTDYSNVEGVSKRDFQSHEPVTEISVADFRRLTINDVDFTVFQEEHIVLDFDLIPFFEPLIKESKRGALASASLGSGNRSISSGFNSMDMGMASADIELSDNSTNQSNVRSEEGGTTYRIGIGAELPIGRKWSLQSGVGYMVQQAPGISNAVYDNNGTYQPLGTYSVIEPGTIFLSNTYNYTAVNSYFNIPVILKYPIIDKKIKFRVGAGLSTELMLRNTITTQEYGTVKNQLDKTYYNPFGLSGVLNLDLRFKLQGSYALAIESGIRKGFTSINSSQSKYPTSFNVGVILFYQFK